MSIYFVVGSILFIIFLVVTVPKWNLSYDLKHRLEKTDPKWGRK